jgi:hypothetical protein
LSFPDIEPRQSSQQPVAISTELSRLAPLQIDIIVKHAYLLAEDAKGWESVFEEVTSDQFKAVYFFRQLVYPSCKLYAALKHIQLQIIFTLQSRSFSDGTTSSQGCRYLKTYSSYEHTNRHIAFYCLPQQARMWDRQHLHKETATVRSVRCILSYTAYHYSGYTYLWHVPPPLSAHFWTSRPPASMANAATHMHSEPSRDINNIINSNSTSKSSTMDLVLATVSLLFRNLVQGHWG